MNTLAAILDQKVQCLVTTDFIYLYLFEPICLPLLSLALITLITCFVLSIRLINSLELLCLSTNKRLDCTTEMVR